MPPGKPFIKMEDLGKTTRGCAKKVPSRYMDEEEGSSNQEGPKVTKRKEQQTLNDDTDKQSIGSGSFSLKSNSTEFKCAPAVELTTLKLQNEVQFLREKVKWLEKKVSDLETERDFLRNQLQVSKKSHVSEPKNTSSILVNDSSTEQMSDDSSSSSSASTSSSEYRKTKKKSKSNKKKEKKGKKSRRSQFCSRAKDPEEVIERYNKVLKTFTKVKTMSQAFSRHNVDRGTIAATAAIVELALAAPSKYETMQFNSSDETLLAFAKRCSSAIDEETKQKITKMKTKHLLLPLQYKK
ncbi:coiled-coil domain-containing protein 106-like isoform X1 [Huso huso]|uniref:Coiled-coil domain-containing protein 106-like isoform X1 n=1 Tax=Huso huso TaxID=61971 RepID=A0ABR0ZBS7_HUSHU